MTITEYTVRWLDPAKPDPIQVRTFDNIDSVRGLVSSAGREATERSGLRWLTLTVATITHHDAADGSFMRRLDGYHPAQADAGAAVRESYDAAWVDPKGGVE